MVQAAAVSWAFLDRRFLSKARENPWALVKEESAILSRLEALAQMDEANLDTTTARVRQLLLSGYSKEALVAGLLLLRDVRWSTLSVEQGHASATLVHKFHTEYTTRPTW